MQNTQRFDPEPLHALTQSLRAWVLSLALWLAEAFEPHLPRAWRISIRESLRQALDDVRVLLVLLAFARITLPILPDRTTRPRATQRGFRHARLHGDSMRCFKRLLRVRTRTIRGRLAHLRDVLSNLKPWIARMVARLKRLPVAARLVAVAPPACVFAGRSAPACVGADTS